MLDKTIVIGALARDCAISIRRNKTRIEQLRECFKSSYVVIFENDSIDDTKKVLEEYSNECNDVIIISKDYYGKYPFSYPISSEYAGMSCNRIARMVFFRNQLLEYIRAHFSSDYIAFLDIDIYDFDVDGVVKSIKNAPTDWGALFANGYYTYKSFSGIRPLTNQYDSYAYLRYNEDCQNLSHRILDKNEQYKRSIEMSQRINEADYYLCNSAFGGMAIYKSEVIEDASYKVLVPTDWEQYGTCLCEHVPFNMHVCDCGYKCYMARNLRVNYGIYELPGLKGILLRLSPSLLHWLSQAKNK